MHGCAQESHAEREQESGRDQPGGLAPGEREMERWPEAEVVAQFEDEPERGEEHDVHERLQGQEASGHAHAEAEYGVDGAHGDHGAEET